MTAQHIPDIVLERYRLNELPAADAERMKEHVHGDARLGQRLAALDQSDHDLREPLERMRSRLRDHAATRPNPESRIRMMGWPVPAAVALCVVLAVSIWRTQSPAISPVATPATPEASDRIKGTAASGHPGLAVYRRTNDGSELLAEGSVAHPGDLIRVGYHAAGRPYGVIVSIDGRGAVTMHLPPDGDRAAPLKTDATVLLDQAYELDDAPRWERFYFVAGDTAFDAAAVVQAARAAAQAHGQQPPAELTLPRNLEQAGFTLQKESRR